MELIVLSQSGCRPCVNVKNFLDNQEVFYNVVDVQQNKEYIDKYNIMSTPVTILLDSEGNEVQRSSGFNPEELSELVSKL